MRKIDICFSPELLHLHEVKGKIVVVVDIFRATSCMTTAIANGVGKIIPVASITQCADLKKQGCIGAAERDGKKAKGFDLGNSPFSYMNPDLKGKTVAVTTTNGTLAITRCKANAKEVLIGSFLNKSAVVAYLKQKEEDVLVLCAGWKGKFNLEDSLYAGALAEALTGVLENDDDSALASKCLYMHARRNLKRFLAKSSHFNRLKNLNIEKDIDFCLQEDIYEAIPTLKGDHLEILINEEVTADMGVSKQ